MKLNTVIFDMDGLLIDSEPLWSEAADEVFATYNIHLTLQQHHSTTGMRTKEFVHWWFTQYQIPIENAPAADKAIVETVIAKVITKGKAMQGIEHIFNFFIERQFKIGLASSSSMDLIDFVVDKLAIRKHLQSICSASSLAYGKPHPQVYLNCAEELNSHPLSCICFEDSFNGLIAAKAARMKCVVIPAFHDSKDARFNAADLKLSSLQNFNDLLLQTL
jgi:mannitol-1-/sugar-/sorbitol-6-/2-deoxyglucose-6-phosphatase